jgi:hypothetical protein
MRFQHPAMHFKQCLSIGLVSVEQPSEKVTCKSYIFSRCYKPQCVPIIMDAHAS